MATTTPAIFPATSTPALAASATPMPTPEASLTETPVSTPTTAPSAESACFPANFVPETFFPDSMRMLGRTDTGVVIFNLNTLEEERFIEAPQLVYRATLSPDGQTLAWALEDNTIQLIRLSDQEVLATLTGHTNRVDALKFFPAGDRLASGSNDGWVKIWDTQGNLLKEFLPGGLEVLGLGISPDGTRLVTITFEGPPKIWDLAEDKPIAELGSSGASNPADAVFSPDGRAVGISLGGFPTSLWQVPEGTQLWSGGNFSLALSPDGRYLAHSDADEAGNPLVVLRSADGEEVMQTLSGHIGVIWRLLFSPDGSRLISAGEAMRVWEVPSGQLLNILGAECP